jgi:hypothetical protein
MFSGTYDNTALQTLALAYYKLEDLTDSIRTANLTNTGSASNVAAKI